MKYNTKRPELHSILVSFTHSNLTQTQIADCTRSLQDVVSSTFTTISEGEKQDEEVASEDVIVRKLTVAMYAAIEVEAEGGLV